MLSHLQVANTEDIVCFDKKYQQLSQVITTILHFQALVIWWAW